MNHPVSLLVTAAGSELAFAVIKAAKLVTFPLRLIGCDLATEVVGKYWCDDFRTVPPATREEEYLGAIERMIQDYELRAIVPTADAEFELLALHKQRLESSYGCSVLVNPIEEVRRFNDKWLAHEWYRRQGIPTPKTFLAGSEEDVEQACSELGFPLLIKPRTGGGSRHIHKVFKRSKLQALKVIVPDPILQEYVLPDDEEYTAGTYRQLDGDIFTIVMKRRLKFGMTNTCESLLDRQDLNAFCRDVISKTKLVGSNNIQFRLGQAGPLVLEINARFSGTTGIRANCGFNDLEMWLRDTLGMESAGTPPVRKRYVMRFMEEMYI